MIDLPFSPFSLVNSGAFQSWGWKELRKEEGEQQEREGRG